MLEELNRTELRMTEEKKEGRNEKAQMRKRGKNQKGLYRNK